MLSRLLQAAGFPCPSPELALALAQRVLDLYRARAEREFRYSDNVRVLLEIAVTVGQLAGAFPHTIYEPQALPCIIHSFIHSFTMRWEIVLLVAMSQGHRILSSSLFQS